MTDTPPAARLSPLRRLAYGLAVPAALFVAAELTVRIVDPAPPRALLAAPLEHAFAHHQLPEFESHDRLFWRIRPNLDQPLTRHGDRTDAWGLRNERVPGPKSPSRVRVACLGDSCTYGLGVTFYDAWPALLGRDTELDVINAGVPGYSSHQGVELWDESIAETDPDVVVIEYGVNDVAPWPTPDGDHWAYLSDRERQIHLRFAQRPWGSALLGWLGGRAALTEPRRLSAHASIAERVKAEPRVGLTEFAENVRTLGAGAEHAIFLGWPFRAELERPGAELDPVFDAGLARMRSYRRVLERAATLSGNVYIDVGSLFHDSGLSPGELFVDDVHATRAGAQLVADAVARAIRELKPR